MKSFEEMLGELAAGERRSITVTKEEFMAFREVLIRREDFKQFRGEAAHHGRVTYTYENVPRN